MKILRTIIALIVLTCSLHFQIQADDSKTAVDKLKGPLRDVVELYRTKSKISDADFADFMTNTSRRAGLHSLAAGSKPGPYRTGLVTKVFPAKQGRAVNGVQQKVADKKESVLSAFILPEIQKRWGNPSFDVLSCNVVVKGSTSFLSGYNAKVRTVVTEKDGHKIVALEVAGPDLEKIAEHGSVKTITPVLKKGDNNDQGAWATGAKRLRIGQNGVYTKGYTGKGVIVGVIDTGIDWTHEDFIDPETGKTRIKYLWDTANNTPGKTPADLIGGALSSLNYGTLWTKEDIDAGLCTSTDTNGHGTHVAGSAAGNGSATGKYTGMAPNSDIVFVQGFDNNGVLFIYEVAKRDGKPCTVNMSYGPSKPIQYTAYWPENYPADGSSDDARKFKQWNETYGGGHIPVKAAGNSGDWDTYDNFADYPHKPGGFHSGAGLGGVSYHTLDVPDYREVWYHLGWGAPAPNDYPQINVGMWYESPVQITFISPAGDVLGPMVHGTGTGSTYVADHVNHSGVVYYDMDNPVGNNGHFYAKFQFKPYFPVIQYYPPGRWTIKVEPIGSKTGNVDMWCGEMDVYNSSLYWMDNIHCRFLSDDGHRQYIRDEGASQYMITVGNYTTKLYWASKKGGNYSYTKKHKKYSLCPSSSPGPARNRFMKPDIAAPGNIIISVASKDATAYYGSETYLDPDGKHGGMTGTSMASPHVAGGLAMVLEKYPNLDVPAARNLIQKWARTDGITSSVGPDGFGKGIFRIDQLNEKPVAKITCSKQEVVLDDGDYSVVFDGSGSYDPEGFPITYTFTSATTPLNGAKSAAYDFKIDGTRSTLKVDGENEARYTIQLVVNDGIEDSNVECKVVIDAKFYPVLPPNEFTLTRVENDLIFIREYINKLKWKTNPDNKSKLKNYVIYKKVKGAEDSTYSVLATLDPATLSYDDRDVKSGGAFTYKIVAVNYRDKVSDPVTTGN